MKRWFFISAIVLALSNPICDLIVDYQFRHHASVVIPESVADQDLGYSLEDREAMSRLTQEASAKADNAEHRRKMLSGSDEQAALLYLQGGSR